MQVVDKSYKNKKIKRLQVLVKEELQKISRRGEVYNLRMLIIEMIVLMGKKRPKGMQHAASENSLSHFLFYRNILIIHSEHIFLIKLHILYKYSPIINHLLIMLTIITILRLQLHCLQVFH